MHNVNDIFRSECRYVVRDLLGQGTFGQVVRCVREDSREEVAVKVIKNQTAFYHQVPSHALCLSHYPQRWKALTFRYLRAFQHM
jgi:serine/threonine protein kinase